MTSSGSPPASLIEALLRAVADGRPRRLLYVAGEDDPCGLEARLAAGAALERIQAAELLDPPPADWRRPELCVACAGLGLEGRRAEQALARLRDLYCERVLLLARTGPGGGWTLQSLRALGFLSLVRSRDPEGWGLYGFDLYDYKSTPDWLNPRFWAHPELWDRYRW